MLRDRGEVERGPQEGKTAERQKGKKAERQKGKKAKRIVEQQMSGRQKAKVEF